MTTPTTDPMRNDNSNENVSPSNSNIQLLKVIPAGFLAFTIIPIVNAANWEFVPSISVNQTYSDNINLGSGKPSTSSREDETGCLVSQINPGLSIGPRGEPGRVKFNFNIRSQNIIDAGCKRGGGSSFLQQEANLLAEVIKQSIFLEAKTSISQQNGSNTGRIQGDNLADTGNRIKVRTYSVSPYWTPHIGNYADGEVRFRYGNVDTSGGNNVNTSQISDSQTYQESVHLENGSRFTVLFWNLDFNNEKQQRDGSGGSVRFRQYQGEIGARLTREITVFAQGGNADNDFRSVTNSNQNGAFYSIGGGWTPSPLFSIRAAGGNNSFVTVDMNPSRRTTIQGSFFNNNVGTNTGGRFQLSLEHQTRRTVWGARYFEDTTTSQDILANQQVFAVVDAFGNPILNPVSGQPNTITVDVPTLTDEVLVRKRSEASFTGRTALSTVSLRVYNENRHFQESDDKDDVLGADGSWNWRLGKRTSSNVRARWQKTNANNSGSGGRSDNEFTQIAVGVNRSLSRYFTANLEYQFQKQNSDNPLDEYDENRVTASLNFRY